MAFVRRDKRETCPYHFSLHLFMMVRRSSCGLIACWTFALTSSLATWSLYEMHSNLQLHLISMACILLWRMDVTRERISRILELREILLSFQTGSNFVNAAIVCAILESISSLEPSSVSTEPRYRYLKLVTVSSFCPLLRSLCRCHWCCH